MFAKFIGKPFQYEHCWNILKMERKWTDNLTSNKRAKTHSTGSPAESTHVESCSDPRARPDPVGGSEPKPRGLLAEAINQIPLAITFHDPGTPV